MILYDDKTINTIKNGTQLVIPFVDTDEDITFKASYVVASNLRSSGKISALFDLVVLGNVDAEEIDIKGRFICLGNCNVSGTIVVQNDMWGEDVQAKSITCHDRIVAQSIDAGIVIADGNIIIGKTLAIERNAQTNQKIVCGETAYGAGKIMASSILTAEPLDLDDGEEALESPFQYITEKSFNRNYMVSKDLLKYEETNDYVGFIDKLMEKGNSEAKKRYKRYLTVLKVVERAYPKSFLEIKDVSLLIWLLEISNDDYFKEWHIVNEWTEAVLRNFKDIAEGKVGSLSETHPATELEKGDIVLHKKFGKGTVRTILQTSMKGKISRMTIVDFDIYGEKKFPLPDSLKFFSIISEGQSLSADNMKETIQCNIDNYSEWLLSLQLIERYKEQLGTSLYNIINNLLLAKLGLKPKFVTDRFKEKGWS